MQEPTPPQLNLGHEPASKNSAFILKIPQENAHSFVNLVLRNGLLSTIKNPERHLGHAATITKNPYSPEQLIMLERIKKIYTELKERGIDLQQTRLSLRYVRVPLEKIDGVIQQAYQFGGKRPDNPAYAICVDETGYKAQEGVEAAVRSGDSTVVFIYDDSKLTPLTQADHLQIDPLDPLGMLNNHWARKPIEGLGLEDALVGMIAVENSITMGWSNQSR